MDGVHDLGGKQGFGPVAVEAGDLPFRFDWEERMWGIARAGVARGITIDWFRHGLERMVPADYLSSSYFEKWAANYLALLVDNGAVTMAEALRGHVEQPEPPAAPLSVDELLAKNRGGHISFVVETAAPPAFKVGEAVRTRRRVPSTHTRLPQYAAAAGGTVTAHHGPHALPDRGAAGERVGENLYTVEFRARELWGEAADPRDTVRLDLWESYLVRP